jgi:diguanylate cyclase (GGDEF)-like protein
MKIHIGRYIQLSIIFVAIVLLSVSSFYFFDQRRTNAQHLLEDLRSELVEVNHVISIKSDSYESIQLFDSMLARKAANDKFIQAFIITDEQKVLLTTDNHYHDIPSSAKVCTQLRDIDPLILLEKDFYKSKVNFYVNDQMQTVYVYLILNHTEVDEYLNSTMNYANMLFLVLTLLTSLVIFLLHRYYIIHPLELLRQFAYYQSKIPPAFRILELEYVRSSLIQTFRRLEEEKQELYELARIDQLSGLMNRNALHERTDWLIAEASRENTQFAVLFLDLDHFKDVNDSLGHKIGDALLKTVAGYLQEVIRTEDFVARIGGDEFVIVVNNYESHLELTRVMQRLLDRVKEPFIIETHPIYVSASVGVVLYPKDGTDMPTLLKHADIAMYEAKRKGRDQYHFFTDSLNHKVQKDIKLEKDLRSGIKNHEFKLYYQPKVDLQSGLIVGCEALIRWFHPSEGMVPPDQFIPLCENTGFIIPLGEWVMSEAARQQVQWKNDGICDMPISVNVSVKQLHDEHYEDKFNHVLKKTGIQADRIDIEITENIFMENSERNIDIMKMIRANGSTISMDDFGTGYSSLSYLKKFPMDTLKIDKSFMDDYESQSGAMFIETIVNMGKTLEMSVVAEGVETANQIAFLKEIGCDLYQGYYCSKPLDADSFAQLVQKSGIYH